MTPLYRAMGVMISQPLVALIPGLILLALYFKTRKILVLIGGLTWIGYCLYETGMKLRILCGGECNIRIDLVVIYPILFLLSLAALAVALFALRTSAHSS